MVGEKTRSKIYNTEMKIYRILGYFGLG